MALNVDPTLNHFRGIIPCGVTEHGVTSLARFGVNASMAEVDVGLRATFDEVFAAVATCAEDLNRGRPGRIAGETPAVRG